MKNPIHTFETCVNCLRQHSAQIHLCTGCGFELPRVDLSELSGDELRALAGDYLALVSAHPRAVDTIHTRRAAGLLVLADRELQFRAGNAARDHGHRVLEPLLYAGASRP